jgi:hypothetical protein
MNRPPGKIAAAFLALLLATGTWAQSQSCVQPPPNLVSWWPGDGNANDIQDGNNGTLQNGATFAPGLVGQAFSFDGAGAFVDVPDSPNLSFGASSSITVDLWAFRTGTNPVMHLMGKREGCSGINASINYQMALNTASGEGLAFGSGFGNEAATGMDLPLNTWTHLAGTFDGTAFRFYINGVLAATAAGTLGPINTAPLEIGGSGTCATFAGLIDEVEIFNRALSNQEIQAISNAGNAGKCKTPQQSTQAIINSVNALFSQGVLNRGQDNSLVVKLQHAINVMNAGKNDAAIRRLDSFINEVNDLLSSGVLSPSQAASLVGAAQSVIAAL